MVVYKYFPDSEHTEDSIKRNVLFLAQPSSFNDPYDCFPEVEDSGSLAEKIAIVLRNAFTSQSDKEAAVESFTKNPDLSTSPIAVRLLRNSIRSGFLVCCFSETNVNRLMWSHYSKHHTGLVLEYTVTKHGETDCINFHHTNPGLFVELERSKCLELHRVKYSKELPIFDFVQLSRGNVYNIFTHKDSVWEYEQELRLLKPKDSDTSTFRLEDGTIRAVYFGSRMVPERIDSYCKILKENELLTGHGIAKYAMRLSSSSYGLYPVSLETT